MIGNSCPKLVKRVASGRALLTVQEAVEAPALVVQGRVFARFAFLNQLGFQERLDGTIQGAGAEPHAAASLLSDLAHNGVTMEIFAGEREKNLEGGGWKRVELLFWHDRLSIHRWPSIAQRGLNVKKFLRNRVTVAQALALR